MYYVAKRIIGKIKKVYYFVVEKRIKIGERSDISGVEFRLGNENSTVKIGNDFGTRKHVIFNVTDGELIIGNNVFINDMCAINVHKKVVVGENTIIGQNVLVYDHDHDYSVMDNMRTSFLEDTIIIGKNVWIGSGVIILRGSRIGDNSVIGAGCVIKGLIPPNTLVYQERETIKKTIERKII